MSTIEKLLEKQHGDLHQTIPLLVNRLGQVDASKVLGVTQSWLSRWLARNGYVAGVVYVKMTDKAREALKEVQS